MGGITREFTARINAGTCRVELSLEWEPEGLAEKTGGTASPQ